MVLSKGQAYIVKVRWKSKKKKDERRLMDEEMEDTLLQWICDMRGRNLRVSHKMIKLKAKTLGNPSFKASNGWLRLFMKRNGLSL